MSWARDRYRRPESRVGQTETFRASALLQVDRAGGGIRPVGGRWPFIKFQAFINPQLPPTPNTHEFDRFEGIKGAEVRKVVSSKRKRGIVLDVAQPILPPPSPPPDFDGKFFLNKISC